MTVYCTTITIFIFILLKISAESKQSGKVIVAACALHNFLQRGEPGAGNQVNRLRHDHDAIGQGVLAGGNFGGNRGGREAFEVRNLFKEYFNSAQGSVTWQQNHVNRGVE